MLPNDDSTNSDSTIEVQTPYNDDPCGSAVPIDATFTVSQVQNIGALAAACSAKPLCVAFTTSCKLYAANVQGRAWAQVPNCFSATCTTSAPSCVGTYIMKQQVVTKQVEVIRSIGLCTDREDPATGKKHVVCYDTMKSVITSMLRRYYAKAAIAHKPKVTWPIQKRSIGCGALC